MWKEFFALALNLVPPVDADPAHIRKYHITISLWILTMTVLGTLGFALAFGFVTFFFPGFAKADAFGDQFKAQNNTIVAQNKRLDSMEMTTIGAQMFTLREKQCKAPEGSKEVYTNQLNVLWGSYIALSHGQAYRLPGCEEF